MNASLELVAAATASPAPEAASGSLGDRAHVLIQSAGHVFDGHRRVREHAALVRRDVRTPGKREQKQSRPRAHSAGSGR